MRYYILFFITAAVASLLLAAAKKSVFGQTTDFAPWYQAQRNGAMDLVAQCSAANTDLQKRIAELEKRLEAK